MSEHSASERLSGLIDDELDAADAAALRALLAEDADLASELEELRELKGLLAEHAPELPSASRWERFEADLEASIDADVQRRRWAGLRGLGPALAAAGLLLALLGLSGLRDPQGAVALAYERRQLRLAPYRGPGDAPPARPPATPELTALAAQAPLERAGQAALARSGVALSAPTEQANLAALTRRALSAGEEVLATAELAALLFEGSAARLAQVCEREALLPRLRRLLPETLRALEAYRSEARSPRCAEAAELAILRLGVADLLVGGAGPRDERLRSLCEFERARILEARDVAVSVVLGRVEDYAAYAPPRRLRDDPERRALDRGMRWLARGPWRLSRDLELRAAALQVAALARCGGFASWNEMDELLALTSGPRDDLGMLDLRRALQSVQGAVLPGADGLASDEVIAALRRRLEAELDIAPRDAIAGRGEDPAGSLRWLAGGRSVWGLSGLLTHPQRPLPSLLDLPAALGSSEARGLLGELGADRFEALRRRLREDEATSSLDARRLTVAACALKDERPQAPARSWVASLALLWPRAPAAPLPAGGASVAGRLWVEPQPELFGRLSQSLEGFAQVLERRLRSAEAQAAAGDARRVARWLSGCAERGRGEQPPPPAGQDALAAELCAMLPAFEGSAGWSDAILGTARINEEERAARGWCGGAMTVWRLIRVGGRWRLTRGLAFDWRLSLGPSDAPREAASRPLWLNAETWEERP